MLGRFSLLRACKSTTKHIYTSCKLSQSGAPNCLELYCDCIACHHFINLLALYKSHAIIIIKITINIHNNAQTDLLIPYWSQYWSWKITVICVKLHAGVLRSVNIERIFLFFSALQKRYQLDDIYRHRTEVAVYFTPNSKIILK